MRIHQGILDFWAETGTEGAIWILTEDGKSGYESMVELEEGDRLRVFDGAGECQHDVVIDPDRQVGRIPLPLNPKFSQQCALGFWVHWIQRGWEPDAWAALFIRRDGEEKLRAELHRSKDTICGACAEDGFDGDCFAKEFCDCGRRLKKSVAGMEVHCCEACARKFGVCKYCGGSPVETE